VHLHGEALAIDFVLCGDMPVELDKPVVDVADTELAIAASNVRADGRLLTWRATIDLSS